MVTNCRELQRIIKNIHWNRKIPWSWRHRQCPAGGPPLFSPWWPGGQWRPLHPPPPCRSAPASPRRTRWTRTETTSLGGGKDRYEKCIFIIVSCDFMKRTFAQRYKLPLLLFIVCIQFKGTLHHFGTNNATHQSCYRQGAGTLLWTANCVVLLIIYHKKYLHFLKRIIWRNTVNVSKIINQWSRNNHQGYK